MKEFLSRAWHKNFLTVHTPKVQLRIEFVKLIILKNMKKIIHFILIAGVFVVLSGCGASRVNTDTDEKANFGNYHTFRFTDSDIQTGPNPVYHSSLIDNTIH